MTNTNEDTDRPTCDADDCDRPADWTGLFTNSGHTVNWCGWCRTQARELADLNTATIKWHRGERA